MGHASYGSSRPRQARRINRDFYATHAEDFLATRASPWPGWADCCPTSACRAAGRPAPHSRRGLRQRQTGRLARDHLERPHRYVGLDRSLSLLSRDARATAPSVPRASWSTSSFRRPSSLPRRGLRRRGRPRSSSTTFLRSSCARALIDDLLRVVRPGGLLALSFWQFAARSVSNAASVPWRGSGRDSARRSSIPSSSKRATIFSPGATATLRRRWSATATTPRPRKPLAWSTTGRPRFSTLSTPMDAAAGSTSTWCCAGHDDALTAPRSLRCGRSGRDRDPAAPVRRAGRVVGDAEREHDEIRDAMTRGVDHPEHHEHDGARNGEPTE